MADIHTALHAIMAEAPAIGKDESKSTIPYKYRSIDAILAELQPLFVKHEVLVTPIQMEYLHTGSYETRGGSTTIWHLIRVRYRFTAVSDGSTVEGEALGEGADTSDKAMNKAMTYALKAILAQGTLLRLNEGDPDGERFEREEGRPFEGGEPMQPELGAEPDADERPATPAQLKPVWKANFAAVEAIYGKLEKGDERGFEPMNYVQDQLGIRTAKQIRPSQIDRVLRGIAYWQEKGGKPEGF